MDGNELDNLMGIFRGRMQNLASSTQILVKLVKAACFGQGDKSRLWLNRINQIIESINRFLQRYGCKARILHATFFIFVFLTQACLPLLPYESTRTFP